MKVFYVSLRQSIENFSKIFVEISGAFSFFWKTSPRKTFCGKFLKILRMDF